MSGLGQLQPYELSHLGFISTASRRDQSSAVHRGILMVHTGGHREGEAYRLILGRCVRQWRGSRQAGIRNNPSRGDTQHREIFTRVPVGGRANGPWSGKKSDRAPKRRHECELIGD